MKSVYSVFLIIVTSFELSGCTYFRNRCDDFSDILVLEVGGTAGRSPLPPSLGLYLEATEFLHLGAMHFKGGKIGIDRRGLGIAKVNNETKFGIGPFHRWYIDEFYTCGNRYKNGSMTLWESRMGWEPQSKEKCASLFSPFGPFHNGKSPYSVWSGSDYSIPAKIVRYGNATLGSYPRGWEDWGFFGLDFALSEPFLLHVGGRVRAGIDFSQIMDFVLGIFTIDIYNDDATTREYEERSGSPDQPVASNEPRDQEKAPSIEMNPKRKIWEPVPANAQTQEKVQQSENMSPDMNPKRKIWEDQTQAR